MSRAWKAAAILLISSIVGCSGGGGGGGGGGGTPQPLVIRPVLQVLPATYNFGRVTGSNTPAPLEVTIRNTGNAPLVVSSINLTAASNSAFTLNLSSGTRPCGSAAPTVNGGDACTFRVAFQPPGSGVYDANVQVTSNDAAAPSFVLPVTATVEAVSALTVRINQLDTSCPTSNAATAYVSVTDQGGFPLRGLATTNFTLTENSTILSLNVTTLDAAYKPLAISAALDNSGSITNQPVAYAEMKAGFATLFNAMRANDVGQLINFGTQLQVTVPFPSPSSTSNQTNKAALLNGLTVPWTGGVGTLLYDSVYRAIDDAALQTAYRRAVIVATDGIDLTEDGSRPASTHTLAEVISNARSKNVAVFAIGIGTDANGTVLQDLASQTGGLFFRAPSSQNLATIYAQLSTLLFKDQYDLTFNQLKLGTAGTVAPLDVRVVSPTGIQGNGTGSIVSCN
jgi:Ca-activated chloride channel family protein